MWVLDCRLRLHGGCRRRTGRRRREPTGRDLLRCPRRCRLRRRERVAGSACGSVRYGLCGSVRDRACRTRRCSAAGQSQTPSHEARGGGERRRRRQAAGHEHRYDKQHRPTAATATCPRLEARTEMPDPSRRAGSIHETLASGRQKLGRRQTDGLRRSDCRRQQPLQLRSLSRGLLPLFAAPRTAGEVPLHEPSLRPT
jgi:hypothetical protein